MKFTSFQWYEQKEEEVAELLESLKEDLTEAEEEYSDLVDSTNEKLKEVQDLENSIVEAEKVLEKLNELNWGS